MFTSHTTKRRITTVAWLLGMLLAAFLIAQRPNTQIRGLVVAESITVAAPTDGLLLGPGLELFEDIAAGTTVGFLSVDLLEARREVLRAEIEALKSAEKVAQQSRSRLLARDSEDAVHKTGTLTARLREGEAQLKALGEERLIQEELFRQGVIPAERVASIAREIRTVKARISAERENLKQARGAQAQALLRRTDSQGTNVWEVERARRELQEVETKLSMGELRAPIAGQVSEIFRSPGEWLRQGDKLLKITQRESTDVIAWATRSLEPQTSPEVRITGPGGQSLPARLDRIGSERMQLPRDLWARFDAPEWGYPIQLTLTEDSLAAGTPVMVGLKK